MLPFADVIFRISDERASKRRFYPSLGKMLKRAARMTYVLADKSAVRKSVRFAKMLTIWKLDVLKVSSTRADSDAQLVLFLLPAIFRYIMHERDRII
jgi:hypothetical protein